MSTKLRYGYLVFLLMGLLGMISCEKDAPVKETPGPYQVNYRSLPATYGCLKRFEGVREGLVMRNQGDYDRLFDSLSPVNERFCDSPTLTPDFDFSDRVVMVDVFSAAGCNFRTEEAVYRKPGQDSLIVDLTIHSYGFCLANFTKAWILAVPDRYKGFGVRFQENNVQHPRDSFWCLFCLSKKRQETISGTAWDWRPGPDKRQLGLMALPLFNLAVGYLALGFLRPGCPGCDKDHFLRMVSFSILS